MADRKLLTSSLFESSYRVNVWLIGSYDTVHRKNPDFALDAIRNSGFADFVVEIVNSIPSISKSILGNAQIENLNKESFAINFLSTNCTHHVNYHDNKMCTVELVAKFTSSIKDVLCLSDNLIEHLHFEVETPVGNIQV